MSGEHTTDFYFFNSVVWSFISGNIRIQVAASSHKTLGATLYNLYRLQCVKHTLEYVWWNQHLAL